MGNKLVGILTAFLFIAAFSGCLEDTSKREIKSYPLNSLALNLDDLPQGYIKWSEESNYSQENTIIDGIKPLEYYSATFAFKPEINTGFPAIALSMYRFNSSSDTKLVIHNLSEQMISYLNNTLNRITPQNVQRIGDESIYELFEGNMGEYYGYQNATWSFIYFRNKNIAVHLLLEGLMEWDINYVELTLKYAMIIDNRINAMPT